MTTTSPDSPRDALNVIVALTNRTDLVNEIREQAGQEELDGAELLLLLACHDAEPVGYVALRRPSSEIAVPEVDAGSLVEMMTGVLPAYQRRGVGRQLTRAAAAMLLQRPEFGTHLVAGVAVANKGSKKRLQRLGFKPVKCDQFGTRFYRSAAEVLRTIDEG